MLTAQSMQGGRATDCVAIYQPMGWGGALIGDMRDLAYIRVLLEVEDKVG